MPNSWASSNVGASIIVSASRRNISFGEILKLRPVDRDLTRASRNPFFKLLVAGRVDAGGLRVSRSQVEGFRNERGYLDFLETGAKTKLGCEELIAKNSSKRSSTLRWWCGCITRGPSRRISSGVTPPTSRLSPGSNWV